MVLRIEWIEPDEDLARGESLAKTDVGVATIIPKLGERKGGHLKEIVGYHADIWLFDVRPNAQRRRDTVIGKMVPTLQGARNVAVRALRDNDKLRLELAKPKRKSRKAKRGKRK